MPFTHRIRLPKEEACVMVGHRALVPLVFLTVVLSLSACVAGEVFREAPVQPPASWPITTASGQQSISLLISVEGFVDGVPMNRLAEQIAPGGKDSITRAYRDSGLFSDVKIWC